MGNEIGERGIMLVEILKIIVKALKIEMTIIIIKDQKQKNHSMRRLFRSTSNVLNVQEEERNWHTESKEEKNWNIQNSIKFDGRDNNLLIDTSFGWKWYFLNGKKEKKRRSGGISTRDYQFNQEWGLYANENISRLWTGRDEERTSEMFSAFDLFMHSWRRILIQAVIKRIMKWSMHEIELDLARNDVFVNWDCAVH